MSLTMLWLAKGATRTFPLLGFAILAGCNGAHLYNKTEHEWAQKAETSFKAAKLSESVKEERELMAKMLDRELQVVRRHVLARRDLSLVVLLQKNKVIELQNEVEDRIDELAVRPPPGQPKDPAAFEALIRAYDSLDEAESAIALREKNYRLVYEAFAKGEPDLSAAPTAESLPGVSAPILRALQAAFTDLENARKYYQDRLKVIEHPKGGKLAELSTRISQIEEAQSAIQKEIARLSDEYDQAKTKYDDAIEHSKQDDVKALAEAARAKLEELAKAEEKAGDAQQKLDALGLSGLGLDGLIESIKKRQAVVQQLLDAVISEDGKVDPKDSPATQREKRLAAVLPLVYRDFTAGERFPKVGVLVIESNRLRLELEAAKNRRDSSKHVLDILRLQRDHMLRELTLLSQCRIDLADLKPGDELIAPLTTGERKLRLRANAALLNYTNAWTVHRVAEEQATYMLIAARHSASLDATQAALAQWQNLIGEPITQLVALHGTGLKPEDVSNLIQALGLTAIGIGVN